MKNRNLGKFEITLFMIDHEPEKVAEVFGLLKFIPLRAECLYYKSVIEYIGLSERFSEVEEGMEVPNYTLIITEDSAGHVCMVEVC